MPVSWTSRDAAELRMLSTSWNWGKKQTHDKDSVSIISCNEQTEIIIRYEGTDKPMKFLMNKFNIPLFWLPGIFD